MWIQDLREICERSYNERSEGQSEVSVLQLEWRKANTKGEVDGPLLEGLERRAATLLGADDSEWSRILEDDDFWKAGWGSKVED